MILAERIGTDIERRIRSGEWRPGFRIPFEHELVAQYGCARATVSKALAALARTGLIERRRKAGSFVAHPHIRSTVLDIPDIGLVIEARGDAYRYEGLERRVRAPRPSAPGEEVFARTDALLALSGVHFAADAPFGFEARVISLAAVPEARHQNFSLHSPGSWLLGHVPWTDARHRIGAVPADATVAHALRLAPGAACLQIERWTWRMGEAITFVRQSFPGNRYHLIAEFTPQPH